MHQSPTKFSVLKFLWLVIKPFKWWVTGQILVAIIWALDLSISPYLIKKLIDAVAVSSVNSIDLYKIYKLGLAYMIASIFILLIFRLYDLILLNLKPNLEAHIGITIMQRMLQHSYDFYQRNALGSLSNKIQDIIQHSIHILKLLIDHFLSHILGLSIAIFTIWYNVGAKFSLALSIWIILFLYVSHYLLMHTTTSSLRTAEVKSQVIGKIVDLIHNILSIHLFNQEDAEINSLRNDFSQLIHITKKRDWYFVKIYFFQRSSFVIFQGICLWWLIKGFVAQVIKPGDFALILMLNISIVKSLANISRDLREFAETIGILTNGLSIVYQPLTITEHTNLKNTTITRGEIIFDKVHFGYKNDSPLFKGLSLHIKANERIGIVGYSGSGKSTFIKLLLRIYEVNDGEILIDTYNIRDIKKSCLVQSISAITQNATLFNRTIEENIRFGCKGKVTEESIINAAKVAHIHDFINTLPQKYKTIVGERGSFLSGGQIQRILLARAILKKTPILILDEAMSQLDSITYSHIKQALNQITPDTTTVIITHRLSTLIQLDRILVFDKGKIVQDGKHSELIKLNGLYQELWNNANDDFIAC